MPPDPEAAVLNHARTHGSISRREVVELWDLSENQAAYLLRKLVKQGKLQRVGRGRGTRINSENLGNSRNLDPHGCDRFRMEHEPVPRPGGPPRPQRWLAEAMMPLAFAAVPPDRPRQPRRLFTASPAHGKAHWQRRDSQDFSAIILHFL
jgi:hypothetical protein